jgi:hypothetical protein
LGQALQGHRAASGIPEQALQLVAPMGGDLGVGVAGKPVDAGTAGTGECWCRARVAKACAYAPDLLTGPLAKGDALLDGGRHGAGQLGGGIDRIALLDHIILGDGSETYYSFADEGLL